MGALTSEEIDRYLLQISTNSKYIALPRNGQEIHLVLHYPSTALRWKADFIYQQTYNQSVEDGLLPVRELESLMKSRGVFKEEDELRISKLEGQLEAQQLLLSKIKNVVANRERTLKIIDDLTRQINELKYKKYSKLSLSAEARSSETKHAYLCWGSCEYFDGGLIWDTYKEYLDDNDTDFKSSLLHEFLDFNSGLPPEIIRGLARSNMWRARYIHSTKSSDMLFGKAISDYSVDQLGLVYWSNFYQQIFEMMPDDRPDEATVEDDKLLDEYLDNLYKERAKETAHRRLKKATKGSMSAFDAEEVIVTKAHAMYQEIEYDKPREANKVKDRADLRKRTSHRRR